MNWPEGISDGLTLPCGICGCAPSFDYIVEDATWLTVAPAEHRLGVICLPCFDRLAVKAGAIHNYLLEIQFVGIGRTWRFRAADMYTWSDYRSPMNSEMDEYEECGKAVYNDGELRGWCVLWAGHENEGDKRECTPGVVFVDRASVS